MDLLLCISLGVASRMAAERLSIIRMRSNRAKCSHMKNMIHAHHLVKSQRLYARMKRTPMLGYTPLYQTDRCYVDRLSFKNKKYLVYDQPTQVVWLENPSCDCRHHCIQGSCLNGMSASHTTITTIESCALLPGDLIQIIEDHTATKPQIPRSLATKITVHPRSIDVVIHPMNRWQYAVYAITGRLPAKSAELAFAKSKDLRI